MNYTLAGLIYTFLDERYKDGVPEKWNKNAVFTVLSEAITQAKQGDFRAFDECLEMLRQWD